MALSREVHNRARPVINQQAGNQFPIADISAHKDMIGVAFDKCQVTQIAGIRQEVEIDDLSAVLRDPMENEI
jgi:hypothetical protein